MIISRTPYRVSFFGGGTDFPEWFDCNGGAVLSTSIDRYCYLTCRQLPRFFEHKHRIVYSKTETVSSVDEIEHPAVREALRDLDIDFGVEVHHHGDLPASSGIGSSSAFAVGLLNALHRLLGESVTQLDLAQAAVRLERDLLQETVGLQDQFACAVGGVNFIEFHRGAVDVHPVDLTDEAQDEIADRMVLVYSGQRRLSADISKALVANFAVSERPLAALHEMALRGRAILEEKRDLDEFGEMLDECWYLKAQANPSSVTPQLESLYECGRNNGALGGKVLGAGGGGFMMFWTKLGDRERFLRAMADCVAVPARPEHGGSMILFAEDAVDALARSGR